MQDSPQWRMTLLTVALVLLIATAAGAALWMLHLVYHRSAQFSAARSVRETARLITTEIANHPAARSSGDDKTDWRDFSRLIRSFHKIEGGLQEVSVAHEGVIVFQEQVGAFENAGVPSPVAAQPPADPADVRIGRELLVAGNRTLPLITFMSDVPCADGKTNRIKIGIKRDAVLRQQSTPAGVMTDMFRVSLAVVVAAFSVCAALVVWMMRRDAAVEKKRRLMEHLTFAGTLANGIAHDFRNPMSSLRLDVQMLRKEAARETGAISTPRIVELSARAIGTIDRMDKVFQEFLFLSKPSAAANERIGLDVCIRDCTDLLASRFEQAGVKLSLEPAGEGVAVVCSPSALKRALVNVLTNALQFSTAGGEVTVRAFANRGNAVIEVLDHGPGIPPADMKRVFEMFVSGRPGGTGLGLALARTAVENCGGSIEAENRAGGGACFRISLPLP